MTRKVDREDLQPWRPKVRILSEETKAALAELEAIHSWEDLVRCCAEQQGRRSRRGL
jgi:hypothetical protein